MFKIGDKVINIREIGCTSIVIANTEGIIKNSCHGNGRDWVVAFDTGDGYFTDERYVSENNIKLIKEEKTMFKVGDKVIFDESKNIVRLCRSVTSNGVIEKIANYDNTIRVLFSNGNTQWVSEESLELAQDNITLSDIKERWLVTFANGIEVIRESDNKFYEIKDGKKNGLIVHISEFNQDLTNNYNHKLDIVSVHKPHYDTIWTREDKPVKKMTVSEIASELGYDIEIVKEN